MLPENREPNKIKCAAAVTIVLLGIVFSCMARAQTPTSSDSSKEEDFQNETIKEDLASVEKARASSRSRPQGYIDALLGLADQYHSYDKVQLGNEAFDKALHEYRNHPVKDQTVYLHFWQYMIAACNDPDFGKRFAELVIQCEQDKLSDEKSLDRTICYAMFQIEHWIKISKEEKLQNAHQSDEVAQQSAETYARSRAKSLWKQIIGARSLVRGASDKSLAIPFQAYARLCELDGDLKQARDYYSKSEQVAALADPTSKALVQLQIAQFFVRQKLYKEANLEWRAADKTVQGKMSREVAAEFIRTIQLYDQNGRAADLKTIVDVFLTDGGAEAAFAVDGIFPKLIDNCVHTGNLPTAQLWLRKRVATSSKLQSDPLADDWRMKLSEIDLAVGETVESAKLFDLVLHDYQQQGKSTASILSSRADLLRRVGQSNRAASMMKSIPPTSSEPIRIRYTLLGWQGIDLGSHTTFECYDSSAQPKNPCNGEASAICSHGRTKCGPYLKMTGTIFGTVSPPDLVKNLTSIKVSPVPSDLHALPPAWSAPAGADRFLHGMFLGHGTNVPPGDYIARYEENPIVEVAKEKPGRIRIFLQDDGKLNGTFWIKEVGNFKDVAPADLQFWYNGYKTVFISTNMHAVVYAPNAPVMLDWPPKKIVGAIVANQIIDKSNSHTFVFDQELLGEQFTQ